MFLFQKDGVHFLTFSIWDNLVTCFTQCKVEAIYYIVLIIFQDQDTRDFASLGCLPLHKNKSKLEFWDHVERTIMS